MGKSIYIPILVTISSPIYLHNKRGIADFSSNSINTHLSIYLVAIGSKADVAYFNFFIYNF